MFGCARNDRVRQRAKRVIGFGCAIALAISTCVGCHDYVRASFMIAPGSPLPRFIPIPPGRTSEEFAVKLFVFTSGAVRILMLDRGANDAVVFSALGSANFTEVPCDGARPKTVFVRVETDDKYEVCLSDIVLTYERQSVVLRRGSAANDLYIVNQ